MTIVLSEARPLH